MIDTDKVDVLSRLYRLYSTVPAGLPTLKRSLKESIAKRGKAINESSIGVDVGERIEQAEADPKGKGKAKAPVNSVAPATEWVQGVLELKDKFDNMWQKAFLSDRDIEVAINQVSSGLRFDLSA